MGGVSCFLVCGALFPVLVGWPAGDLIWAKELVFPVGVRWSDVRTTRWSKFLSPVRVSFEVEFMHWGRDLSSRGKLGK